MTYPASTREVEAFTPDSLANMTNPPSFRIRPGGEHEKRTLGKLLVSENLRHHSVADMRAETLNGLRDGWSEEEYAENEGRIKAYWDAYDLYEQQIKGQDEPPLFEHPDAEAIERLSKEVYDGWRPLRVMAAENADYNHLWPFLILCVMVTGWKNLPDARFRREAGVIPLESIKQVKSVLDTLDKEEGQISGVSFMQLCGRAATLFTLSGQEEKNSVSPSPSSSTPTILKTDGAESGNMSSTALESSSGTHAN